MEQPARLIDGSMMWLAAVPALFVASSVLLVPGLIALAPVRMGVVPRVALATGMSIAFIGAVGVISGLAGVPFAAWQVLVPALLVWLLVWAFARRLARPPRAADARASVGTALSWLGSAVVIAIVAFWAVPDPSRISQTYDNVFHLSAISAILESGDASSLTLRTLIEPDRVVAFYPAGWHALVALVVSLSGASVPVATNATWLAVAALVWLPGAAWLAQACIRGVSTRTVAAIALPVATSFGAMPYALLSWGTLYPTFLATALIPAAVAVVVVGWRCSRALRGSSRQRVVIMCALAVTVMIAAIVTAQPRVLATWGVIVFPAVLGVVGGAFCAAWRAGGIRRRKAAWSLASAVGALLVIAGAAFAYAVLHLGLFTRPIGDRLGGPQALASQSLVDGLRQVLTQAWPTGIAGSEPWPSILLGITVIIGIILAVRVPVLRWVVVSYAILAILFVLAAGSDDVVTKLLTGLWYKDRYRLSSALPILGVVLATLAIVSLGRWMRRRGFARTWRRVGPIALAWSIAVTSATVLVGTGASGAIGEVFRLPADDAGGAIVSQAQIDFMENTVRTTVPDGERVLGDPWDGSAWTQLFAEREPVFPHVNGQWDAHRLALAWRLQDIETDPTVCAALDALRVRYVLFNPHVFGGGDPSGNHFPGPHAAVSAGLFTPVASDGDSQLYRVDQCGPLP